MVMLAPTSKRPEEREFVVDSGASMHVMSKKELSSEKLDTLRRSRNPHCGAYSQWRSAYKRGSTRKRSRSTSIRDGAITGRNASCSIAWKTLRRPRMFLWVGQWSKTVVDQRREDNCMQNGQLRTSRCYRVIHQFWEQFVVIDTAGLVKYILQVQQQSEVTNQHQESGVDHPQKPETKKKDGNRDSDNRLRDPPEWLLEFTDNLEDTELHAPAHVSQDSDSERPTKVVF